MKKQSDTELLLEEIKKLNDRINDIQDNDLDEKDFVTEEKQESKMLEINPTISDSYGDSIELVTKSRLKDYGESYTIALNFVEREYHNMMGNRYGKHSKLIPVDDNIDLSWFSGSDIKIVEINGKKFYKIRLLVYDILVKKMLLTRIPTSDGKARHEEIQYQGAALMGNDWVEQKSSVNPLPPIDYKNGNKKKMTMKNVGEIAFDD